MDKSRKPFYSIAHRVLTAQGVRDALSHGANAIEIDLAAWDDGWWADHDAREWPESRGDKARDVFSAIAQARQAGQTVTFVWFDIKTPDKYSSNSGHPNSTFDALRALGREILEPHGIRVLYGFYETANCVALKSLKDTLTNNEAVNLDGPVEDTLTIFDANGVTNVRQRVLSRGLFDLDVSETGTKIIGFFKPGVVVNFNTVRETLKSGAQSGRFGKVFAWTIIRDRYYYLNTLLSDARVDGVIHGFKATHYYDHADTRAAAKSIREWLQNNTDVYQLATQEDTPW